MALPGFNAETSLYRTSVDYHRSHGTAVRLAGVVPQLVDPVGTHCLPCNRFGLQFCVNCFIEPGRCFSWSQKCSLAFR
jgi:hypothetical protein